MEAEEYSRREFTAMQANPQDRIKRIALGIEVHSSDGEKVGKTDGVQNGKLVVKYGWWRLGGKYYVPAGEVGHATDDVVRLTVSRRSLDDNERYWEP